MSDNKCTFMMSDVEISVNGVVKKFVNIAMHKHQQGKREWQGNLADCPFCNPPKKLKAGKL